MASETYTPEPRLLTLQEVEDVRWRAEWLKQWICRLPAIVDDGLALMHAKAILDVAERAEVKK